MRMRLADRQTKWNEVPGMPLTFQQGGIAMQRVKHPPIRNKIDMTDPAQVRAWTKRLRIGADDLKALIEKVGNSVSAVTKEVELGRMSQQPSGPQSEPSIPSEAAEPKLAPI